MTSTESGVKPARRHPLDFVLMRVFCFGGGEGSDMAMIGVLLVVLRSIVGRKPR